MARDDERNRSDGPRRAGDSGSAERAEESDGRPNAVDPDAVDAAFDALADERRRLALYYLRGRESATLDELATVVSGWQQARAPGTGRVTPDDREGVRIALHHVHLPRLADAGFVSYDADAREVTVDRIPHVLDSVLDRSLADDRESRRGPAGRDDREPRSGGS